MQQLCRSKGIEPTGAVLRKNCVTRRSRQTNTRGVAHQGWVWRACHKTRCGDVAKSVSGGWPLRVGQEPRDLTPCVGALDCTTRRHDTHSIDCRELRYPWHPWNGQQVWIWRSYARGGVATFHCALEPHPDRNLLEI